MAKFSQLLARAKTAIADTLSADPVKGHGLNSLQNVTEQELHELGNRYQLFVQKIEAIEEMIRENNRTTPDFKMLLDSIREEAFATFRSDQMDGRSKEFEDAVNAMSNKLDVVDHMMKHNNATSPEFLALLDQTRSESMQATYLSMNDTRSQFDEWQAKIQNHSNSLVDVNRVARQEMDQYKVESSQRQPEPMNFTDIVERAQAEADALQQRFTSQFENLPDLRQEVPSGRLDRDVFDFGQLLRDMVQDQQIELGTRGQFVAVRPLEQQLTLAANESAQLTLPALR